VPAGTVHRGYFTAPLEETDPAVADMVTREGDRQRHVIELIASENIVSRAVLEAQGSLLTNKTVEGYPGRRYHGGAAVVDEIERLGQKRAKALFGAEFANLQPHSGSQANQVVLLATVKPGDTILSMALDAGGHLSHGARPNMTGKWFDVVQYGVTETDGLIDYAAVARLARANRPKLIIAGGSAYPRVIDFASFRAIADDVGATLLVDMAHFAGLVAGGQHPSPLPHAHVVTTTTYKSLRGARGGLILSNNADLAKKIDSSLFPGLQGSPLLHAMAAKTVCLGEALKPEFKAYAAAVLSNARTLAFVLQERGYDIVTGGTDTPLMLVDLRAKRLTGAIASDGLDRAGLTCNKNAIPFDPKPPAITSGIRLGVSAGTTRGFGTAEFGKIGALIADLLDGLAKHGDDNAPAEAATKAGVKALCEAFPIY